MSLSLPLLALLLSLVSASPAPVNVPLEVRVELQQSGCSISEIGSGMVSLRPVDGPEAAPVTRPLSGSHSVRFTVPTGSTWEASLAAPGVWSRQEVVHAVAGQENLAVLA